MEPAVVVRTCRALLPWAEPTATHALLEQEIVFTVPEPAGIDAGTQSFPPSVVTTS